MSKSEVAAGLFLADECDVMEHELLHEELEGEGVQLVAVVAGGRVLVRLSKS